MTEIKTLVTMAVPPAKSAESGKKPPECEQG